MTEANKGSKIEEALKDPYDVEMEDFFNTTDDDLDEFDEESRNKGKGYECPNFPGFDERMEGLDSGLYLFAGESNSGKSAIMSNLQWDFATHPENKLFGIYYSLDDGKREIIPRVIAMNQLIPISVASKPMRYQEMIDNSEEDSVLYTEWLEKRAIGLQQLKDMKRHFKIVDGTKITCGEQLYNHLNKLIIYLKAIDPEYNVIVAIDSVMDLEFPSQNFKSSNDKNDYVAKKIKSWAVNLNVPIFGSMHLRKLNGNRRPTLDDLKESGRYVYESSCSFLVHNDVSKNGQSASVYYNSLTDSEKHPILELHWAKNKKSSYKGRTHHYFTPNFSKITECATPEMKRFDALIYES